MTCRKFTRLTSTCTCKCIRHLQMHISASLMGTGSPHKYTGTVWSKLLSTLPRFGLLLGSCGPRPANDNNLAIPALQMVAKGSWTFTNCRVQENENPLSHFLPVFSRAMNEGMPWQTKCLYTIATFQLYISLYTAPTAKVVAAMLSFFPGSGPSTLPDKLKILMSLPVPVPPLLYACFMFN